MVRPPNEDRTFGAKIHEHPAWDVEVLEARSAYANRPGLADIHIYICEATGEPRIGEYVMLDTMPSVGIGYPSAAMRGWTNEKGYIVFPYRRYIPGGKAVFRLKVGEFDELWLITDLTTIILSEYPIPPGGTTPISWIPMNKEGQVTYDIRIVRK